MTLKPGGVGLLLSIKWLLVMFGVICWMNSIQMYTWFFVNGQYLKLSLFFFHYPLCSLCPPFFFTPGPPIITADATQHAVKHSKGKLECRVGSSPPPDKIVSEPLICAVCHSLMFESFHTPRSSYSHTHMRWITQRSFIPDLTFTPLHPHISTSRSNKHARTHRHTRTYSQL